MIRALGVLSRMYVVREYVMAHRETRATAEELVQVILHELADMDEDETAPAWCTTVEGVPAELTALTVGEVRQRLRITIEEIAARDSR